MPKALQVPVKNGSMDQWRTPGGYRNLQDFEARQPSSLEKGETGCRTGSTTETHAFTAGRMSVHTFPTSWEPKFPTVLEAQRQDYEYCLQQLRQMEYGAYLINVLHAEQRARCAHAALFAFNLQLARIKDSVSNEDMGRLRLSFFRNAVHGIYDGSSAETGVRTSISSPTLRALCETIQRFALPVEPFEALFAAREQDLKYPQPHTIQDLVEYTQASHGSCIALHARILHAVGANGEPPKRETAQLLDRVAMDVGTAAGLATLLRGAPYHAACLQTYVPRDVMEAWKISAKELVNLQVQSSVDRRGAFQSIALVAEEYLERARSDKETWKRIPRSCRLAFLPAVLAADYLRKLRASGYDAFDRRLQLPMTPGIQLRLLLSRLIGRLL